MLNEERWTEIDKWFGAAIHAPEAQRNRILSSCPDPELRAEVAGLLEADVAASRAGQPVPGSPEIAPIAVPRLQFGAYRAIEAVGRGGTSTVYRAERTDGTFEKQVALKVVTPFFDRAEFQRRFKTERQLLASLEHPNITRLLDGGVSESGHSYLIMEFVEGQHIDTYCNQRKLDVRALLDIFLQVCEAAEYAHRNLVVHGDLKPGNILVNSEGVVKLLDFGTACLLDPGADRTMTGHAMLTPRYASPEQLRAERFNVTTDVYSLGVILYELLAGVWPFGDPSSLVNELGRATGQRVADAPSTFLTRNAAESRSTTVEHLRSLLKGDLGTIVMKMIESEPGRRYGSAKEVSEDIQRYCHNLPILARPQTNWYRASKFLRRNWLKVSVAAAAALALTVMAVSLVQSTRLAQEQALRAKHVSQFAKDTFFASVGTSAGPIKGPEKAIQFQDVLDNAVQRVGAELKNDPLAEADIRGALGSTYASLGDPAKGEVQIRHALRLLPADLSGDAGRIASDLYDYLCNAQSYDGRYVEALQSCRSSVDLARKFGSSHFLGGRLHDLAYMAAKSGLPLAEVEGLYQEALAGSGPSVTSLTKAVLKTRIGALRFRRGDLKSGEAMLRECIKVLENSPGPPIEIIPAWAGLAIGHRLQGRYDEAVALLEKITDLLALRPAPYMGPDQVEMELAAAEALAGKPGAITRMHIVESRVVSSAKVAADRVRFGMLMGTVEARSGMPESAERRLRTALAVSEAEVPQQPEDRVEICVRLAEVLAAQAKHKEAASIAAHGLRIAEQAYGQYFAGHPFSVALANYPKARVSE